MKTTEREQPGDKLTLGKGRFESFSDGVFAIAITLLILEVRLPTDVSGSSPGWVQAHALIAIWPQYLVYVASFATIGIMWLNHHAMFDRARKITHGVVISNLALLALVSFLPFTTEVLGRLGLTPAAVVYYGITLTAISIGYFMVQQQVWVAHPESRRPLSLWNLAGLAGYPLATIVGFFVPVLGVTLIALLAFFYMLPRNVSLALLK